ncbi:MAG: DUF533 domain-containing protein [Litorimonas sp.]
MSDSTPRQSPQEAPTSSLQGLLSQLLGGVDSSLHGDALTRQARELGRRGEDLLVDRLGLDGSDAGRAQIRQQAKYAGIAGALALLVKSKSARKVATLGGLAALGAVAYKGHKRGRMPDSFQDAIGLLTGDAAEDRADRLLRAMIAAAKADGIVTDEEKAIIDAYPGSDPDVLAALFSEPSDPASIAALATSDQCGAEIYAVSARVADGTVPADRDYLDRLAMGLGLDPEAAALIETEVRTG